MCFRFLILLSLYKKIGQWPNLTNFMNVLHTSWIREASESTNTKKKKKINSNTSFIISSLSCAIFNYINDHTLESYRVEVELG